MDRREVPPRGLVSRSLIAVGVFAAAVVPGWTLGDLVEHWTGWGLLDWLAVSASSGACVYLLAPHSSYRRRDAWLGLVPLLGWYLSALMAWRGGVVADPGRGARGGGPLGGRGGPRGA